MDETQPLIPREDGPGPGQHLDRSEVVTDSDIKPDPDDPLQWPSSYRWGIVALLALMAFTV